MLATLVPVIVGGVIALAGGWFGPWVLEGRKEKAEKKKRRAEKFEELVAAIYEFDHWLDNERTRGLGGSTSPPEVSPFAKIQAISAVHFPSFDPLIRELDNGAASYRVWIETVPIPAARTMAVLFAVAHRTSASAEPCRRLGTRLP